jgi:hypothetical protein
VNIYSNAHHLRQIARRTAAADAARDHAAGRRLTPAPLSHSRWLLLYLAYQGQLRPTLQTRLAALRSLRRARTVYASAYRLHRGYLESGAGPPGGAHRSAATFGQSLSEAGPGGADKSVATPGGAHRSIAASGGSHRP